MTLSSRLMSLSLATATAFTMAAPVVHADNNTAIELLGSAKIAYNKRARSGQTERALDLLAKAESEATDTDTKFEIYVLESRALYYKGKHESDESAQMDDYDSGMKKATEAKQVNPSLADGYYWYAVNLGVWVQLKGPLAFPFHKDDMERNLAALAAKRTYGTNKPGETLDSYGLHRILGRMYYTAAPLFNKSFKDSIKELDIAYGNGPENALNAVYLADALKKFGESAGKTRAKQILKDLLAKDPSTYNKDRIPETNEEFAMAKALLASLGN